MKGNYFDLLSPCPIYLPNAGGVISPTLRAIASVGIDTYQYYLSVLSMDLKAYLTMLGHPEQYEALSEEEKARLPMFDLLTANAQSAELLQKALDFFIKETVVYHPQSKSFTVLDEEKHTVGMITKEVYPELCALICRRNYIRSNQEEDLSKVKSKKALEIMKKLRKGRTEKAGRTKTDQDMELGNIISAVANKSQSLNIQNIWDLTVFQLWDCFSRLSNNSIYDIQSMCVAAWGNKDNHFDAASWYKRIYNVSRDSF